MKQSRKSETLRVLAKPPEWADRSLAASLGRGADHLAPLEPKARGFNKNRLQTSLVPFYRGVVDGLGR